MRELDTLHLMRAGAPEWGVQQGELREDGQGKPGGSLMW